MVSSSLDGNGKQVKKVLGLGYWVQGFRCFPWLAVIFFLKDGLSVDPSTLQILQNSANLPMVGKPFYGLVSDSIYIYGQHRLPYVALGAFLQVLSWLAIANSPSTMSIFTISIYLLLSNLGAAIAEVANDAIVAEMSKQPPSSTKNSQPSSSGNLQSFVWIASSVGGVLGNLLGGIFISRFAPQSMFLSISSYAIIPALTGTMFFYQTEYLQINSSVLGISKVFGQATMLLWGIIYNQYLKSVPSRKIISTIQAMMAFLMISDFLFVKGFYREIGVPDSLYVVIFSGFLEVLFFFKILPFSVLIAQLCPQGCEGSIMAFLMSAIAFAFIVSGYFGVALASYIKVTGTDFSGLPLGLLIQAACTILPIFWSSCIPDDVKSKAKKKD
ncbi:putative folate-biopterin transporter, major facilitator superfamily domain-containing protein [Lupinus albus]|uniref:Putative folate-biopterin transporter, major facilitator superfamily domain-containing protein n=1 Tax=Lupinus albus TaxID=3870 RepID=A0A6A4P0C9_LUPAL|nr:putative folate-biopterin transporter, major facilitator superfamily domain-containing protein [Lupinus albus]